MHYAQLLPRLFVGSHPRLLEDIERLQQQAGVTAIMNLQTDEDLRSLQLAWEPLRAGCLTSGLALLRLPVRDGDSLALAAKLRECVRALDRLLWSGHTVYLHCTAGVNRSPTVAIAYLHWCWGWDLEVAVVYVRHRRECSPNLEAIRLALASDQGETRAHES